MRYIDNGDLKNKKVLVRVDYNVSLNDKGSISNDERIKQTLPTLNYLLENGNKLILMSHLGEPKGKDEKFSLKPVAEQLQTYLPDYKVVLKDIPVILSASEESKNDSSESLRSFSRFNLGQDDNSVAPDDKNRFIYLLENLRFSPGEKANDPEFARQLSLLADAYVNDAFGASHRSHASIVGVPQYIPSYAGFLLKKEIEMIGNTIKSPQKPLVVILGGSKISTKIRLIGKLIETADYLLLAGGLAHNFLLAEGKQIGKSIVEESELEHTNFLRQLAKEKNTEIALPVDAVVQGGEVKNINTLTADDQIFDIGPETQAHFGALINQAKTIIWNGPVGKFEEPAFKRGTDFIYYAITENSQATSIVGGGDTLSAMTQKEHLEKISHISTGGGAMLEFIENGTLPGIEALR